VLTVLAADTASLLLLPFFNYARSQRLRHFGARAYGFLGVITMGLGLVLIPVSVFGVVAAGVVRFRGTGINRSASDFVLGCAAWLLAPLAFLALGRFQAWFSRRLDPSLWDKKMRAALRRRRTALRRPRNSP
jgi:hypothetical protein